VQVLTRPVAVASAQLQSATKEHLSALLIYILHIIIFGGLTEQYILILLSPLLWAHHL